VIQEVLKIQVLKKKHFTVPFHLQRMIIPENMALVSTLAGLMMLAACSGAPPGSGVQAAGAPEGVESLRTRLEKRTIMSVEDLEQIEKMDHMEIAAKIHRGHQENHSREAFQEALTARLLQCQKRLSNGCTKTAPGVNDMQRLFAPRGPGGEDGRRSDQAVTITATGTVSKQGVAAEGLGESARELDAAENNAWDTARLTLLKNTSAKDAFLAGFGASVRDSAMEKRKEEDEKKILEEKAAAAIKENSELKGKVQLEKRKEEDEKKILEEKAAAAIKESSELKGKVQQLRRSGQKLGKGKVHVPLAWTQGSKCGLSDLEIRAVEDRLQCTKGSVVDRTSDIFDGAGKIKLGRFLMISLFMVQGVSFATSLFSHLYPNAQCCSLINSRVMRGSNIFGGGTKMWDDKATELCCDSRPNADKKWGFINKYAKCNLKTKANCEPLVNAEPWEARNPGVSKKCRSRENKNNR